MVETRVIKIEKGSNLDELLEPAVNMIKKGCLVAFPTETVYGLGADALNDDAVKQIFKAKERPADDPMILHVSSKNMVPSLVEEISPEAGRLMDTFWPGPLTLIFKKSKLVPDSATAGLPTVAIRMPSHPVAAKLIHLSNTPIAAPSANLFERPSPTNARRVLEDLEGRIECIIDAGDTDIGVESTILDLVHEKPTLLRPGGIKLEEIEKIIGPVEIHPSIKKKYFDGLIESPGMKSKHYAPKAKVILVEGGKSRDRMESLGGSLIKEGKKLGFLLLKKGKFHLDGAISTTLGHDKEEIAKNLYEAFRDMDEEGVDVIITEDISEEGLGLAIMNRLRKAADDIIEIDD
ncbi:MAG: L-threonylcarbamoyladenylate synthase [Candidatus Hodarchaeota archaeon]